MEVHQHSHTPDSYRDRKKWKHYFWEFLMLFLAITLGFFVENQREHLIEHRRARDYSKSLLGDLRADTAELRAGVKETKFIIRSIDSLIGIVAITNNNKAVPGMFYYYSKFTSNSYQIDWNKSTINQLIQSGNLRYFRNKDLVEKINKFYALAGIIINQNLTDLTHRGKITELRNRMLQSQYYSKFAQLKIWEEVLAHVPSPKVDSIMTRGLPLQEDGSKLMEEFINYISDRKLRLEYIVETYYPQAIAAAEEIINIVKEEYRLE